MRGKETGNWYRSRGSQRGRSGLRGTSKDWRANCISVFVGNLSTRVSNTDLWEIFSDYGKVRDVFISRKPTRGTSFAFVRYGMAMEARNAINHSNRRVIDGLTIRVNTALNKTQQGERQQLHERKESTIVKETKSIKNGRAFTDVVREGSSVNVNVQATNGQKKEEVRIQRLEFSSKVTKATLTWLQRSAFGRLKSYIQPRAVQEALSREGISVDVGPYGGLSVIVTFADREVMEILLKEYHTIFSVWFQDIKPWDASSVLKEKFLWVSVTGIPLQLWHAELFKKMGELWASYISMDASTERRFRLDQATILISSKEGIAIPSQLKIAVEDKE